jgi:hypothetical protein
MQGLQSRDVRLLGGIFALLVIAAVPLGLIAHRPGSPIILALNVLFVAIGVLVARRQPDNAIGWILIALALGSTVGFDSGLWGVRAYRVDHHGLLLSRLGVALAPLAWASILLLLPLPIMLFPDGRVPAGRWRWMLWGYVTVASAFAVSLLVSDLGAFGDRTVIVDRNGQLASFDGSPNGVAGVVNMVGVVAYAAFFLASVVRLLIRFRRSAGVERQQLKWLLSGGVIAVTGLLIGAQSSNASPLSALFVAVIALPLSMGVAILRYRLYEIDRLISRTISYTILTGFLVAVFLGIVLLATRVLPFSSPVAIAASTLAAAALFNPLRLRIQHIVDRRFNRARYDQESIVADFRTQLRTATDPNTVRNSLQETVHGSVQPAHTTLWLRPGRKPDA